MLYVSQEYVENREMRFVLIPWHHSKGVFSPHQPVPRCELPLLDVKQRDATSPHLCPTPYHRIQQQTECLENILFLIRIDSNSAKYRLAIISNLTIFFAVLQLHQQFRIQFVRMFRTYASTP